MSLAEKVGPPFPTHHLTTSGEYAVFEICCKECKQVLAAVVGKTGSHTDLVWPLAVVCGEEHKLVKREPGIEANIVVTSKGVSAKQAIQYLCALG